MVHIHGIALTPGTVHVPGIVHITGTDRITGPTLIGTRSGTRSGIRSGTLIGTFRITIILLTGNLFPIRDAASPLRERFPGHLRPGSLRPACLHPELLLSTGCLVQRVRPILHLILTAVFAATVFRGRRWSVTGPHPAAPSPAVAVQCPAAAQVDHFPTEAAVQCLVAAVVADKFKEYFV